MREERDPLNTDFVIDNIQLGALMSQSMSQVRWSSRNVFVTLSHHFGLLRYFAGWPTKICGETVPEAPSILIGVSLAGSAETF